VMAKGRQRKAHDWMRAQDAARALGVTRPTVLAMVARGELSSLAVAGLVFVKRSEVEARAALDKAA
jgi:excisionase family DNA binding protein